MGGIERNPQVCINHLDQNLFSWITLMDTLMIYMDLFFITVIFSSSGLLEKQLVLHKVDFLPTSCVCVWGGAPDTCTVGTQTSFRGGSVMSQIIVAVGRYSLL